MDGFAATHASPPLWQQQPQPAVSPGQSPGAGGAIYPAAAAGPAALAPVGWDGGGGYSTSGSPQQPLPQHAPAPAGYAERGVPLPAPGYAAAESPPQLYGHAEHARQQQEEQQRLRAFEQRLADLEARLAEAEQRDEASWQGIHGQVDQLREALDTQQKTRDALDDRKEKELQLVKSTMQVELDAEKQERREVEQLMLRQIDERLSQLREDVGTDAKRRDAEITQRNDEMARSIDALGRKIDRTQQLGEERVGKVSDMLREEIGRLTNILGIEKKMRETTESTMFKMLEEMCVKLQKEIAVERRERERAEEGLLRLLEDTCSRVETSMRHQ